MSVSRSGPPHPWTLPANEAVALNADLDYVLVKGDWQGRNYVAIVLADELKDAVVSRIGLEECRGSGWRARARRWNTRCYIIRFMTARCP